MIECPTCKISFSPRFRICPQCKTYEARLEDRMEYLAESAEAALGRGESPKKIQFLLLAEGLSPQAAGDIVSARVKKVARSERSYGLVRLFGGLGMLLLGSILMLLGVVCLLSGFGVRLLLLGLSL